MRNAAANVCEPGRATLPAPATPVRHKQIETTSGTDMLIGHINLAASIHDTGASFIGLVEALDRAGMKQHVLVRNATLAKRVDIVGGNVAIGPIVQSPVTACCLMPRVDITHVHEPSAGQAGLLLALTRSIPYILTHRATTALARNPLLHAVYRRAAAVICQDDSEVAMLRHWLPGLKIEIIPDVDRRGSSATHQQLYQNSQRMPTAGRSGIQ